MNILQMGTLELQEYIENLVMENPTLELANEVKSTRNGRIYYARWTGS